MQERGDKGAEVMGATVLPASTPKPRYALIFTLILQRILPDGREATASEPLVLL
jgi:hypothetical protein